MSDLGARTKIPQGAGANTRRFLSGLKSTGRRRTVELYDIGYGGAAFSQPEGAPLTSAGETVALDFSQQ